MIYLGHREVKQSDRETGETKRTKQQAVSTFMMEYADSIRQQENGRPDYPLRRQTWNDFVDMLQRVGDITSKQRDTWTQPAFCNK